MNQLFRHLLILLVQELYYLTSGIQSLNDKFDLKPSILIKTEGVTYCRLNFTA